MCALVADQQHDYDSNGLIIKSSAAVTCFQTLHMINALMCFVLSVGVGGRYVIYTFVFWRAKTKLPQQCWLLLLCWLPLLWLREVRAAVEAGLNPPDYFSRLATGDDDECFYTYMQASVGSLLIFYMLLHFLMRYEAYDDHYHISPRLYAVPAALGGLFLLTELVEGSCDSKHLLGLGSNALFMIHHNIDPDSQQVDEG